MVRLTSAELIRIRERTEILYELWNSCHRSDASWVSQSEEVAKLMEHLNRYFPGYHVMQLLHEVEQIKAGDAMEESKLHLTSGG